jgi:DNA-binding PadR family transcriptional regulator
MPPQPNGPSQLTTTGHTLLGLLSFGRELSGYELKRWSENLRFFWAAPAMSQVYREVERLTAGGYVEQRLVVRDGTRETKVYRITPAGRRALRAWLAKDPEPPVLKHPVALRVFFGHLLEPDELRRAVEAHRDWCQRMLAELGDVRDSLGDDESFRNAALVAEWGIGYYRGELGAVEGLEKAAKTADRATRTDEPDGPGPASGAEREAARTPGLGRDTDEPAGPGAVSDAARRLGPGRETVPEEVAGPAGEPVG